MARILVADNSPAKLQQAVARLEAEGHHVEAATTSEDARRLIGRRGASGLDAAILDVRLRDDTDQNDFSGLLLAREIGRHVATIVRTEYSLSSLERFVSDLPVDIELVSDTLGWDALLLAVRKVVRPSVFIVHGHDSPMLVAVTLFLKAHRLRPIILRELPGGGKAIIEKFEETASNIRFAIVLLTPDDVGYARNQPSIQRPRARQNVIFELGFFIGRLGRDRVAVLKREDVEIPSDYAGVEYIDFDAGPNWVGRLAGELGEAGYSVGPQIA